MLDKFWYQSKTIWGFGIAAVIALGQVLGIGVSDTAVASIVQILSLFLGGYGLRSSVANQ